MEAKNNKATQQEVKDADFKKRVESMKAEMVALSAKHRVDIVPILDYSNVGIKPVFGFVDAIEKYESKVLE